MRVSFLGSRLVGLGSLGPEWVFRECVGRKEGQREGKNETGKEGGREETQALVGFRSVIQPVQDPELLNQSQLLNQSSRQLEVAGRMNTCPGLGSPGEGPTVPFTLLSCTLGRWGWGCSWWLIRVAGTQSTVDRVQRPVFTSRYGRTPYTQNRTLLSSCFAARSQSI